MSDEYENTLKIASKKHDITGIRVFDIREEKMPNLGNKKKDIEKIPTVLNS